MSKILFFISLLFILFTGCDDHHHEEHNEHYTEYSEASHMDHNDHHNEHPDSSDAHHDEDEIEPIAVTHYTKQTELFVEFEPFVVNQPSTFLAHFTTLSDFKPVAQAKVTACLKFLQGTQECFSVDGTDFAGIFKPVAVPKQTGDAMLHISIEQEGSNIVHSLGKYKVYTSMDNVPHEAHEEDSSVISYLKEQQWKVDFATEVANKRQIRHASSAFIDVELPSNARQSVTTSVAGVVMSNPNMKVGSVVKPGDIVAYIVPTLAVGEDTATLQFEHTKAQSTLKLAKSENFRIQKLYEQSAISLKRAQEAKQSYEVAKAALLSIEKKLQRLNPTNNDNGVALKSSIEGKIVDISRFNGSYVQEGELIMQIADTSRMWLKAGVPQSEIAFIGKPTGVELIESEDHRVFNVDETNQLVYFSDIIDPKTRKAYAIFDIDNTIAQLKAGSRFSGKVYGEKENEAVIIAQSAIVNDNGESVVFVQTGGESFERRLVETGIRDSGYIEIRSGVEAGERVVTKGAYRVMLSALAPAAVGHGHAH